MYRMAQMASRLSLSFWASSAYHQPITVRSPMSILRMALLCFNIDGSSNAQLVQLENSALPRIVMSAELQSEPTRATSLHQSLVGAMIWMDFTEKSSLRSSQETLRQHIRIPSFEHQPASLNSGV